MLIKRTTLKHQRSNTGTQRITKRHVPIVRKIVRQVNIEVDVEERMLEHAKIVALRLRVRTLRDMEVCRTFVLLLLVRIVQRVSTKAAVAEPVREPARRVRTRHLDSTTHLMVVDPTVVPYLIARRLVQLGNIAAVAPVRVRVRAHHVRMLLRIRTTLQTVVSRIRARTILVSRIVE